MVPRTKDETALLEIDRIRAASARLGTVPADAAYGTSVAFRHGLDARGLRYGHHEDQKVYDADVRIVPPAGCACKPVPEREPRDAETLLAGVAWWHATKGKLTARFAMCRMHAGDAPTLSNRHLPGARRQASCLIPRFDGAILSLEWKEAVWDRYVMGAPRPRTPSEQQYSDRKLRSRR